MGLDLNEKEKEKIILFLLFSAPFVCWFATDLSGSRVVFGFDVCLWFPKLLTCDSVVWIGSSCGLCVVFGFDVVS